MWYPWRQSVVEVRHARGRREGVIFVCFLAVILGAMMLVFFLFCFCFSSEIGHSGSEKAGLYGTPRRRKHLVAVASPLSCRAYVFLSLLRTWLQVWSTVTPPLRHSCIALFVKFVHMWMCRHELWKWAFEHEVFLTCMWPVHIVLSVRWSFYISMGLLTEKILFS